MFHVYRFEPHACMAKEGFGALEMHYLFIIIIIIIIIIITIIIIVIIIIIIMSLGTKRMNKHGNETRFQSRVC